MSDLTGDQFSIESQGRTPLRYNKGWDIQRIAAVHPDVPPAGHSTRPGASASDVRETDYWHPQVTVGRGENKRPLKKPKTVDNPSAAAPGTAAFLDYEDRGDDVYVHFMNTRGDMSKRGLGNRLMDHIVAQHPGRRINLGRIESSHVYNMKQRLTQQGHDVIGNDRGFFGR